MRAILQSFLLLGVAFSCAAAQDWTPKQLEVIEAIRAYEQAWNDSDADAMAMLCTPNCNRIGARGQQLEGKESIRNHYQAMFATPVPEGITRSLSYKITHTRLVSDDVAIVDAKYRVTGVGPRPERPLEGLNTVVLVKEEGKWLRTAHRNWIPTAAPKQEVVPRSSGMTQAEHRQELMNTRRAWGKAITAGDVDKIFSFWTDDVVIYPVSEPTVDGIDAVREYVRRNRQELGIRPRVTPLDIVASASGDIGYTIGTHEWIDRDGRATRPGRYVTLWRKDNKGAWKCFLEIHSPRPEAPGAP